MCKESRQLLRAIRGRVAKAGLRLVGPVRTKKHAVYRIEDPHKTRTLILSQSASDWRSVQNTMATVERLIKEIQEAQK